MTQAIKIPSESMLKDLIEALERRFGGLREAARVLNVDHQKLSHYKSGAKKMEEFLQLLENSRISLKLSKSGIWDIIIPSKKKAKK